MFNLFDEKKLVCDLYDKDDLELLLDNKFKFTRKYDMERCEKTVELNPIDWSHVPYGDDEWKFVFHRMDYCTDLCIETIKSNDMKYINKAKDLIFDFMSKETEFEKQSGLRTLDTGIRLTVWCKCLEYFEMYGMLSDEEYEQICESMEWQTRLLFKNYSPFQKFSNWGFMQCVGVLNAATRIEVEKEVFDFYEKTFYSHLRTQFLPDGMQWEQSTVYILEVATRMAQLSNPKYMTHEYYEVLKRAANAVYAFANCDDKTVLLGDGDRIDTVGFLQQIAYLTRDPKLLGYVAHKPLREEVYFEFGDTALSFFETYPNTSSDRLEFELSDSGYYSVKTDNNYLSFQNGNLGGGHGHFDNLHVNYSIDGKKILVDSGRHNYVEGYETRQYYKEVSSHNGFELENNIYEYAGAWGTKGRFMLTPIVKKVLEGITYMESSVHVDGTNCLRKVLYLPSGELVLIDTCNVDYKLNFITDYTNEIKQVDDTYIFGDDVKFTSFGGSKTIENCYVSPTYNTRKGAKKLVVKNEEEVVISAFTKKSTLVSKSEKIQYFYGVPGNPIYDALEAIEIKGDGYHYIIAHLPYEYGTGNSVLKYDDYIIYGSVIVYDVINEKATTFKY